MRRLEALQTKKPLSVNQVSPTPSASCTYCQATNHVFEECSVFLAHQMLSKNMNAAFTRLTNNPYAQTYNPDWRNHPNFSLSQNKQFHLPTISPNFPIINKYFPTKFPKVPTLKRTQPILKRFLHLSYKTQDKSYQG